MEFKNKKYSVLYLEDRPPEFDIYNRQKIDFNIEVAIPIIMRILYCKINTLPHLPGVILDIERYKHMMNTEANIASMQQTVAEMVAQAIPYFKPEVQVISNPETGQVDINITMYDDMHYVKITAINVQDKELMQIDIDKKAFYK